MAVPVLSDLREPPVVGKFYMVPVVMADDYYGLYRNLPVIGPAHTDVKHFNFPHKHYHLDARFLSAEERRILASGRAAKNVHWTVGATPLTNLYTGGLPAGRPVLAKRRCASIEAVHVHGSQPSIQALRAEYGEPDAIALPDGRKLCPHRKADLTQFPVDAGGFVTCPLHGLRVRCATRIQEPVA